MLHEQVHIKRGDYFFKLLGFIAVAVHWFNPLVWLAFKSAESDMEMSCDEAVIRKMGKYEKISYTQTLLSISAPKSSSTIYLAFGEGDTKERISNIISYKKPAAKIVINIIVIIFLTAFVLVFNPEGINPVSVSDISANDISYSVLLQDIRYYNIPEDQHRKIIKSLKGIQLSLPENELEFLEKGYSYILFNTNVGEVSINFNETFSSMWLLNENSESNGKVYDVIHPEKASALFTNLMNTPNKPQEIKQIYFPLYKEINNQVLSIYEVAPFKLNIQLPDGWYISDDAVFRATGPSFIQAVSLYNENNELAGYLGYNNYETDSENHCDIYEEIASHPYYFTWFYIDENYELWSERDSGVTALTKINYFGDLHEGILSYNKDLKCYVTIELINENIHRNDIECIASSLEIIPASDNLVSEQATFSVSDINDRNLVAVTAAETHLRKNLGINDFAIKKCDISVWDAWGTDTNSHIDWTDFNYHSYPIFLHMFSISFDYNGNEYHSYVAVYPLNENEFSITMSIDHAELITTAGGKEIAVETVKRIINTSYNSVMEKDNTLELGTTKLKSPGQFGLDLETVELTYKNGIVVSQKILDSTSLRPSVDEVVSTGNVWNGTPVNGGSGKLIWPAYAGRISRGFTGQYPSHNGIDISAPEGTEIYAADSGVVTKALYTNVGYGIYCIIEHGGYQTLYGHCSDLAVSVGQQVSKGDIIAYMGNTGNAVESHLHFEVKEGSTRLDPYNWF